MYLAVQALEELFQDIFKEWSTVSSFFSILGEERKEGGYLEKHLIIFIPFKINPFIYGC
jgi:hypothetical protein